MERVALALSAVTHLTRTGRVEPTPSRLILLVSSQNPGCISTAVAGKMHNASINALVAVSKKPLHMIPSPTCYVSIDRFANSSRASC
ncbi:hypothetical protein ML401_38655 [Bradyrhizobium sp. 62B]|nr:hypothetical protein ML401_38655 [Bradyrhizobium sp. 62B]